MSENMLSLFNIINACMLCIFVAAGSTVNHHLPIDVQFIREIWKPDAEIHNLKEFQPLSTIAKVRIKIITFYKY